MINTLLQRRVYPDMISNIDQSSDISSSAFVSKYSTCMSECDYVVYILAGVATSTNYFNNAAKEIAKQFSNVKIVIVFPYGKSDGFSGWKLYAWMLAQLTKVKVDGRASDYERHVIPPRIKSIMNLIQSHYDGVGKVLLIGHSGGGIIAYKAGYYLDKYENFSAGNIVAVGSPKFLLNDISFNERFEYIVGQKPDPVTRIGMWSLPRLGYTGAPHHTHIINLNPNRTGLDYHTSYFNMSEWIDAGGHPHWNVVDLIKLIKERCS